MSAEVERRFARYLEERIGRGKAVDPEELCSDRPDLIEPLLELVREYEDLESVVRPERPIEPGVELLHYRIEGPLGEGGMGAVYRARDLKLDRAVAIKLLPKRVAARADWLDRFRREARAVAALNHPNIVTIHAVEEADGRDFLVMELVDGQTLDRLIGGEGMELERVLHLACELLSAVASAHERGIVHRDLKPANVMVSREGTLKVLDFGLAKSLGPLDDASARSSHSALTREGHVVGTLAYMSPEQVSGRRVDRRSDVFSLGVLLFEMATGERPFRGSSAAELISSILRDPPSRSGTSGQLLPDRLRGPVLRCLAKRPEDRFADAAAVLAALDAAADSVEVGPLPIENSPSPPSAPSTRLKGDLDRQRLMILLDKVERFWIHDVLERSSLGYGLLELEKELDPTALGDPWERVVKRPARKPRRLPKGRSIWDVFGDCGRSLLILGGPGAGKTTCLLRLARAATRRARESASEPIPVVFNLSSWGSAPRGLADWLVDELALKYQIPRRFGETWIAEDRLLPLLDGLDEVARDHREACIEAINIYRREHGLGGLAVASRSGEYEVAVADAGSDAGSGRRLELSAAVRLLPLEENVVLAYLEGGGSRFDRLAAALRDDESLRTLSQTPLMLGVLTSCFGSDSQEIPQLAEPTPREARGTVLSVFIERLLERRRGGPRLDLERSKRRLSWLARRMASRAISMFRVEQLQVTWLEPGWIRLLYFVVSRLLVGGVIGLSAAAVALFVRDTSLSSALWIGFAIVVAGIVVGAYEERLAALTHGLQRRSARIANALVVGTVGGLAAAGVAVLIDAPGGQALRNFAFPGGIFAIVAFFSGGRAPEEDIHVAEELRWSWRGGGRGLLFGAVLALVFGVAALVARLLLLPDVAEPVSTLVRGVTRFALIFGGPLVALFGLRGREVTRTTRANHGIWASGRNALRGGGICAVAALSTLVFERLPIQSSTPVFESGERLVGVPILMACVGILALGGVDVLRHLTLRVLLSLREGMPLRLVPFLDSLADRALLHRVGGAYVFTHRTLLEHFAGSQSSPGESPPPRR